ncbi:MAG TPA: hypothetical protein VKS22_11795 [Candidatus Binataceae bacterium]|nr:hypothetical protein [Candidatus Binataceae bacterium]
MAALSKSRRTSWIFAVATCTLAAMAGCYFGYSASVEHYSATDSALGEEHEVNYSANDALGLTQDALRGDGILFEVQPDNSIVTLWRDADINTPTGWFPLMIGEHPRYRYEIQVVPEASRRSKIIINVRTEGIADEQLASYKASNRFALFKEIDELAAKYPPASHLPNRGGVNFTLLPNEDLKALAQRVTGKADNWAVIAKDNGLTSPTDVSPFQSVWVRNTLLSPVK